MDMENLILDAIKEVKDDIKAIRSESKSNLHNIQNINLLMTKNVAILENKINDLEYKSRDLHEKVGNVDKKHTALHEYVKANQKKNDKLLKIVAIIAAVCTGVGVGIGVGINKLIPIFKIMGW